MSYVSIVQIILYLTILVALVKPFGWYMATVYQGNAWFLARYLSPFEKRIYRICGIRSDEGMNWKEYLSALLIFNLLGLLVVYLLQRLQIFLPLNPQKFASVRPDLAFNTAVSFTTNTNWQAYVPESTMSYLTQMLGLAVQNFISAATGMSILMALIRGFVQVETPNLGNYWVDTLRGIIYILLPLSFIFALILTSQGVIQNFKPYQAIAPLQPSNAQQIIPMGPAASQIAIKQLGTNGGGFFNANSAHPFENPTPLSNFLELLTILLIPASLCYTFGILVKDKRQGWAILATMFLLYFPIFTVSVLSEEFNNPIPKVIPHLYPTYNMEGKETRFGVSNSALWATATTASANGSTNAVLDSFTPLGGMMSLWAMHLGEVIFGGVGTGLNGMLMLVIITVFVAGLMVGRMPEYLGKKIEPFEMKMASFSVLVMPMIVLILTAITSVTKIGTQSITNFGAHGFTEILYAFTSMVNNNGSSFRGLNSNYYFYHLAGGFAMLLGRYWTAIPVLAIAGSLSRKKIIPISKGTLPTHTPLFIFLLISVIIILGALTFFPALSLGPIVEHLMLWKSSH